MSFSFLKYGINLERYTRYQGIIMVSNKLKLMQVVLLLETEMLYIFFYFSENVLVLFNLLLIFILFLGALKDFICLIFWRRILEILFYYQRLLRTWFFILTILINLELIWLLRCNLSIILNYLLIIFLKLLNLFLLMTILILYI